MHCQTSYVLILDYDMFICCRTLRYCNCHHCCPISTNRHCFSFSVSSNVEFFSVSVQNEVKRIDFTEAFHSFTVSHNLPFYLQFSFICYSNLPLILFNNIFSLSPKLFIKTPFHIMCSLIILSLFM